MTLRAITVSTDNKINRKKGEGLERPLLRGLWCALPVSAYTHYRCCGAAPENFSGFCRLEKSEACENYGHGNTG